MLQRLAARVDRLLTWKRARMYALVLVALYVVAWLQVLVTGSPPLNSTGTPIGGDYIAFHSAARLLLSGQGAALYDPAALGAVQDDLLGGRVPNFYDAYRNPPFYVLLFLPFAPLDLLPGFAAYSVVSLALLALAVWLLLDEVPSLRPRWRGLLIFVFAFPPVYFGLINGENSTLSLLLYVLLYRALARDQDRAAGVWAALGLFKPQLFVVFPFVFLARRQWRALACYALTAVALGLMSLLLVGPPGMQGWLRILVDVEQGNALANAWRMVSLKSFFDSLLPNHLSLSLGLYLTTSLLLVVALINLWSRRRAARPLVWTFTCLTAALVDPHLVDYDLTILIAAAPALQYAPRAVIWLAVLLNVLLLGRLQVSLGPASLQLSTAVVALIAAITIREHGWSANRERHVSNRPYALLPHDASDGVPNKAS